MDSINRSFSDPAWWLTVVVFGLLVNIAASYSKPLLDRILTLVHRASSEAATNYSRGMNSEIESIRTDPGYRISAQLLKIEFLIKFIGFTLLMLYLSDRAHTTWSSLASSVAAWGAALSLGRYWRLSETLTKAWRSTSKTGAQ